MGYILVAEDEVHVSLLIRRKLESAGYTLVSTGNGAQALELALQNKPDLLLLDIMLPGYDGLALCRDVKSAYGDAAPPVILISALGQHEDVQAGLQAGADDYIIKPFSPRLLLERVRAALDRTRPGWSTIQEDSEAG